MLPVSSATTDAQTAPLFGPTAVADAASCLCYTAIALLLARRIIACRGAAAPKSDALWDWMCATDPFASWSFLPLHSLALVAAAVWPFLALGRLPSVRLAELYLASWSMCWFSPTNPFAATPDCVDKDAGCAGWAASGECSKNEQFMMKTCRKACAACVASDATNLHALGPRAIATGAGGALLVLSSSRLLLSGLSEAGQQRVAAAARLAVRPLIICANLLMRTPLAPIVRLIFRLLRSVAVLLAKLLRHAVRAATGCANLVRRRLIVLLGGQVDRGGGGAGSVEGLFEFDDGHHKGR